MGRFELAEVVVMIEYERLVTGCCGVGMAFARVAIKLRCGIDCVNKILC